MNNRFFLFYFVLLYFTSYSWAVIEYKITPNADFSQFVVSVCFDDYVPDYLINGSKNTNTNLLEAYYGAKKLPQRSGYRKILLQRVEAHSCIRYKTKTNKQPSKSRYAKHDQLFDTKAWLWQPEPQNLLEPVKLSFLVNPQWQVSTPWQLDKNDPLSFYLTNTPIDWSSRIAIGTFQIAEIPIKQQFIRVAILHARGKRRNDYLAWIQRCAEAVANIYGRYPVDNAQILIVPSGPQNEAIPWAEVQRGGSTAAHFFVDDDRNIVEFHGDWTGVHELAHMLIPFIEKGQLWISEGIASYYQNVARAKYQMISETIAWQKLIAGFKRGIKVAGRNKLTATNEIMHMYWGGAAIFMIADIQLRQQSHNKMSLASILEKLQSCCYETGYRVPSSEFMQHLDKLSQTNIFTRLLRQQAQRPGFPKVEFALKKLGFEDPLYKITSPSRLNQIGQKLMR